MTRDEAIEALVDGFRRDLESQYDRLAKKYLAGNGTEARFQQYASCVADYFNLPKEELLSRKTRKREFSYARKLFWFICRTGKTALPYSFAAIAEKSGGFDHATVVYGVRTANDELLEYDAAFRHDAKAVVKNLDYELIKEGKRWTIK